MTTSTTVNSVVSTKRRSGKSASAVFHLCWICSCFASSSKDPGVSVVLLCLQIIIILLYMWCKWIVSRWQCEFIDCFQETFPQVSQFVVNVVYDLYVVVSRSRSRNSSVAQRLCTRCQICSQCSSYVMATLASVFSITNWQFCWFTVWSTCQLISFLMYVSAVTLLTNSGQLPISTWVVLHVNTGNI